MNENNFMDEISNQAYDEYTKMTSGMSIEEMGLVMLRNVAEEAAKKTEKKFNDQYSIQPRWDISGLNFYILKVKT